MDNKVKSEIMFHIQNNLDQEVDEKQLLNRVEKYDDYYLLRAYGTVLKFNKDGDLI